MDIIDFLKKNRTKNFLLESFYLRRNRYFNPIIGRIFCARGFTKGYFNVREFLTLLLPGWFKSEKFKVKYSNYFFQEISREIKLILKESVNDDGSVNLYKHNFYIPNDNFYELVELLFEIIIFDQYRAKDNLTEKPVIIDAGANIGTFSVFASNLKNSTIYAFEPAKETFKVLAKNVSPYQNIFCYNLGLGDKNSIKNLFGFGGGSNFEDSGIISAMEKSGPKEEARITTIDDFVKQNHVPKVDFIKIDTEGYESKIIKGAERTIKKFKPIISASAYHHKYDKEEIPKLVKSIDASYKYKLFNEYEEDFVFYAPKK